MSRKIVYYFVIFLISYLFAKFIVHLIKSEKDQTNVDNNDNVTVAETSLTSYFAKFCGKEIANDKNLFCFCKPDRILKFGCSTKLEILNDEPLVAIFHGLFKDKVKELTVHALSANFKKIRLGNEYGITRHSDSVKSENGVLESDNLATSLVYHRLSEILHISQKCQTMVDNPKATVVKYKRGNYFGVHYDANNYTLESKFGHWLGGHLFRRFVESLEMCRNRYEHVNIWICLYKLFSGSLQTTEYWNTFQFGPRLISAMVQLSDVVGGETFFPISGVSSHTKQGDLLIWANVNDQWKRYDLSLHGGCPMLSEEKLIIVVFVPGMCNTIQDINYNLRL